MTDSFPGFFSLVRADLARYRAVIGGCSEPAGIWRLLPGLLSPRFTSVLLYRLAFALAAAHLGPLARMVSLGNFIIFGIEIALRCRIGPGLVLPHTQGTVIGAAGIGANATIFQGVTLGARELDIGYDPSRRPWVGNHVVIGAGAKILGGVQLGDRSRVGANAVVLIDVRPDALAVGIPARVIPKDGSAA